MTKKYHIRVQGCDDKTEIDMDLTDAQAAIIKLMAERVTETSESGCMPRIYVTDMEEAKDDG